MIYAFLLISVGLFIICIKVLKIAPTVQLVIAESRKAVSVVKSQELSEMEKESAVQQIAKLMLVTFASLLVRVALTVIIPAGYILAGTSLGFFSFEAVASASTNWQFIVFSSVAMIVAFLILK